MSKANKKLKVALVHDYLTQFGGAERVLYALHHLFPDAPIYTLFYDKKITNTYFSAARIHSTFLQKLPRRLRRRFRYIAPLAVPAVENINVQDYDLVISSSAFFSKGVISGPDTVHVCYCHTPTKYLWELYRDPRKKDRLKGVLGKIVTHTFRLWDFDSANRVDHFIANSKNTKKRISKYYHKDSFIIYPLVDTRLIENGERATPAQRSAVLDRLPENFFLVVSQLQDYKRIDVAVEAFAKLKWPLVVIGDGPERRTLEKIGGDNVIFLGRQPDDIVKACYERCYAYVHSGKEDFGIAPVEAMLYGKPVLAYRAGGVLESVVEGVNGEFFDDLHPAVLADGVRRLNENYKTYSPAMIKQMGSRFGPEKFKGEFKRVLKRILQHETVA